MSTVPPVTPLHLNRRALALADKMAQAEGLGIEIHELDEGARTIDAGVHAPGSLEAGIWLARLCLSDLAEVAVLPPDPLFPDNPIIRVSTDHPIEACLASQYAGWKIALGNFFAMGSGPMRAAYGGEELFDHIGHRETADAVVGILEGSSLPGTEVFQFLAGKTRVDPCRVTLAVASTRSVAGSAQIVARSVETALHKLHALHFDLRRVVRGAGTAPLPPPARSDLAALGRTNDAILYGGRVTLWIRGNDDSLQAVGPRIPSSSSPDHGEPFERLFSRAGGDFYKLDPGLFSPAEITLCSVDTGSAFTFGRLEPTVIKSSFSS